RFLDRLPILRRQSVPEDELAVQEREHYLFDIAPEEVATRQPRQVGGDGFQVITAVDEVGHQPLKGGLAAGELQLLQMQRLREHLSLEPVGLPVDFPDL